MNNQTVIHWTLEIENTTASIAERCLCYRWLHDRCQKKYSSLNSYLTIPTIVLSTLSGVGSVGSASLFNGATWSNLLIGFISILVGILNTINNYFAYAKRSEGHRISSITYAKIYENLRIELSLPRSERISASLILNTIRTETERLNEISPQIPDDIIKEFQIKFKDNKDVSRPEITNGLDPIEVNRESYHTRVENIINNVISPIKIGLEV